MDEHTGVSWRALIQGALPNIYVGIAIAALLGLAGFVSYEIIRPGAVDPTFSFIGIVIIFMAALTVAATIFVGLKLANPLEAFGLPSGSMRALLAIGVMILFVVFGLPMITSQGTDPVKPQTSVVAADQLQQAIQFHRDQGLRVRVIDYGSAAVPATATTPGRAAAPARFETFGRVDLRSPEEVDFGKQILTAVITLLTSVVSFYFGSRSATDGLRESEGGSPAAPTDLAALRKEFETGRTALDTKLAASAARMDALKAETAGKPERAAALEEAASLRTAAENARNQLAKTLTAADAALAALNRATDAGDRKRHEATAREQLAKAAEQLATARQAQTAYADKVKAIQ